MCHKIPILMYHQVSNQPHATYLDYTITNNMFYTQMNILKKLYYNPITVIDFVNYRLGTIKLPHKPVIITFDDGMEEAVDSVLPILSDMNYKATFYIPTDYIGGKSSWMLNTVNTQFQVISWDKIKELDMVGHEIGAHSITHPHLDQISLSECRNELVGSRHILEEYLGHQVRNMAYPFGHYNNRVIQLVKEAGYYSACTTEQLIPYINQDMYSLPRINIGMNDSSLDFILELSLAKSPLMQLRNVLNKSKRLVPSCVRRILKTLLGY